MVVDWVQWAKRSGLSPGNATGRQHRRAEEWWWWYLESELVLGLGDLGGGELVVVHFEWHTKQVAYPRWQHGEGE